VGAGLAEIRGHHAVSILLYDAGDQQGALTHAGHPIAEILPSLKGELDKHGANTAELDAALRRAADAVDDKAPAATVRDLYAKVGALTVAAERAVAGPVTDALAYRASVIASVLTTAGHEYEEAIAGGKVTELIEYQDGFGFVREAKRLYATMESEVRSRASHEADEISAAFATLDGAFVAPQAPAAPATVDVVEGAAAAIGHELSEAVGARAVTTADPAEVVKDIGTRLDKMAAAYQAGRADEAQDIAAEVYLEGYELIEGDVIAHAKAINDELEPLLASQMRARMRAGAPAAEIDQMVARAKTLLAQALTAIQAMSH
jgi:hypothetical protein